MKKYEYRECRSVAEVNNSGNFGWRLVHVSVVNYGIYFFVEREIPEEIPSGNGQPQPNTCHCNGGCCGKCK